ncbi:probable E3 SUMO-protein ligase RNF212 [Xyrauchen texanus]|uniref:probable E3 SUMO-protein ligase RNF212 n=1 Tax=Xyrauchen texanus TaxID=154827 RepID=UPI0022427156|nr:probable E3 SUMO-protein ligase RNF212 [Xyrauchen texanus]
MSFWICCNSCFISPGSDRQLAVTDCGHVICNVCFQRGQQGVCLICQVKCQICPLSDKSRSDVQALFADINVVAVKYSSEISKVSQFQTRHQKRLMAHNQQKMERMKEAGQKMQQEMQKMSKTFAEQNAYISKLEMTLQQQRYFQRWTGVIMGTLTGLQLRSPIRNWVPILTEHQVRALWVAIQCRSVPLWEFSSGLQDPVMSPSHHVAYRRESAWETPVFKQPSAYKYPSVSCLGHPP